jgi:nucleoid-associated protein YgaU
MAAISLGHAYGPSRVESPRRAVRAGRATPSRGGPESAPLRLTRRGRAVVVGLLLNLAVAGAGALTLAGSSAPADRPAATSTVVVQPGDTLWSIARDLDPTGDPRRALAELKELNDLRGSTIEVGRQLLLPVG